VSLCVCVSLHRFWWAAAFVLPSPTFAPRTASLFKPDATTTLFRTDLLVITPGTLPDGTPTPPDAVMQYKLVDVRRPDGSTAPDSEWQPARQDLWPGHSDWCFNLAPGSMKVCVRSVKEGVESAPSALYAFLVRGRCPTLWSAHAGWTAAVVESCCGTDPIGTGNGTEVGAVSLVCTCVAPDLCGWLCRCMSDQTPAQTHVCYSAAEQSDAGVTGTARAQRKKELLP
jgi:hypothetical protein